MGFSTIIDVLGSMIIGGLLLLILLNMRQNASETNALYMGDNIMQSNLTSATEMLNFYFDRIGYTNATNANLRGNFVLEGRDTAFSFQADMNSDGTIDNVVIALGTPITSTLNPLDRWLDISVNGSLKKYSIGLQRLSFEYFKFGDIKQTTPLSANDRNAVFKYTVNISVVDIYQMPDASNPLKVFTKTIDASRRNLRGNFIR